MTIHDTLKSDRTAHSPPPPPHTHTFATRLLKKMIGFLQILPVIDWRRFNGGVLTKSGTFRFGALDLADRPVSICPQASIMLRSLLLGCHRNQLRLIYLTRLHMPFLNTHKQYLFLRRWLINELCLWAY